MSTLPIYCSHIHWLPVLCPLGTVQGRGGTKGDGHSRLSASPRTPPPPSPVPTFLWAAIPQLQGHHQHKGQRHSDLKPKGVNPKGSTIQALRQAGRSWKEHSKKYQILLVRRDFDSKEFKGGHRGGRELPSSKMCFLQAVLPAISSGGDFCGPHRRPPPLCGPGESPATPQGAPACS